MTSRQEPTDNNITQEGRDLLTLIRATGRDGITRKALTNALKRGLDKADYAQLNLLEAAGFIMVEFVYLETVYIDH